MVSQGLTWNPKTELSGQEVMLLKTVKRTKKLFGFLRNQRLQLFDESFQTELAAVYRDTGAGRAPHPPAFLAMVVILQAYTGVSDAEAVQRSVVDLLWQMVLDRLGATAPAFSQGALHNFRQRLIEHDLDRRLLERTAELATTLGAFDGKKLPKTLRVAIDSKPLVGAGRVEDTINLLGHAARDVVRCTASLLDRSFETVAADAGIPLLLESSIKVALDTDWTNTKSKSRALQRLLKQIQALFKYVEDELPGPSAEPPLIGTLGALKQIMDQDLEPDPGGLNPNQRPIKRGVAKDRRISLQEKEMRHGRKTRTKLFNGFKQHIAVDLDRRLVLACCVVSANRREFDALPELDDDLAYYGSHVDELHVDRGYVTPGLSTNRKEAGCKVISKPNQMPNNGGRYTKRDFHFNLRKMTVTCPAKETQAFSPGTVLKFDVATCQACPSKTACTKSEKGRSLTIAEDELAQQRFLRLAQSRPGRTELRERIGVEHRLAHMQQKQGDRARYIGIRTNQFDLRRTAAVLNLEMVSHELGKAA